MTPNDDTWRKVKELRMFSLREIRIWEHVSCVKILEGLLCDSVLNVRNLQGYKFFTYSRNSFVSYLNVLVALGQANVMSNTEFISCYLGDFKFLSHSVSSYFKCKK